MPSQNPDTTATYKLPSPQPADPPDVPGDMQALAAQVEKALHWTADGDDIDGNVRWKVAAFRVTFAGDGSTFNQTINISRYGFTATPMVSFTTRINNSQGAVAYPNLAAGGQSATELTLQVVNINGQTAMNVDVPVDVICVGPAAPMPHR